jgi:hypothetical protein
LPAKINPEISWLARIGYAQTTADQAFQEGAPEGLSLARTDVQADNLALAVGVNCHSDYRGDINDPAAFALFEVRRIQPKVHRYGQSPVSGGRESRSPGHRCPCIAC